MAIIGRKEGELQYERCKVAKKGVAAGYVLDLVAAKRGPYAVFRVICEPNPNPALKWTFRLDGSGC